MRIWGLTGGIASGKSTIAEMARAEGVPVVSADALYHALVAPVGGRPSALARAVAEALGPTLLGRDGALDRRALAARVFADVAARRRLEAIAHPAIAEACRRAFDERAAEGHLAGLYDVPLLFENGLERRLHRVVVVWVPPALQRRRLAARDGLDDAEIDLRLAAQLPLDVKRARADHVIDNSGPLAESARQVAALVAAMRADGAAPA